MSKPPNILLFMVDELRYPTVYDGPELKAWMGENLVAQRLFREHGLDFQRHYVQSSACAPSRTSIFTGQYPTLHGVSQTDGMGKTAWDPGMSWLDPNTVPTMGDWFRAAGYRTYYKGKWHISHADIEIPGKHESLMTTTDAGIPIVENVDFYQAADRLNDFGFSGWIGPEPHGASRANSGWIRDPGYKHQALSLIDELEAGDDDQPWLLVNSFVNPHDIVFFGLFWAAPQPFGFGLPYPTPEQVPEIPPPPTANEDLSTKPTAQASYVATYPQMFLPQPTIELYRRFYYFLQINVEKYIRKVYQRLESSRFFENTIVVFTTDHGDMLGAHGGMHQKWYNAYEETIHVPLIITSPLFGDTPRSESGLTSHADLLPTLLGLAGVDFDEAAKSLAASHTETRPLVGRDLSGVVRGTSTVPSDPVFFMTYDDVSQGLSQVVGNRQWDSVTTPNQVESIVVNLDGTLWKYSIYTQRFATPYAGLITNPNLTAMAPPTDVPPQYEQYNLTADPIEQFNLAFPQFETQEAKDVRPQLQALLDEQRAKKCLTPIVNEGVVREGGEGSIVIDVPEGLEGAALATGASAPPG
jgi:arylsulfatase A-like enzyme